MDKAMFDKVVELAPGQKAVVLKNVSINEDFFEGHFPGMPVMPGALIVEAMSQAALMLLSGGQPETLLQAHAYRLKSLKAKFIHPVFPGDQLRISVSLVRSDPGEVLIFAEAIVAQVETTRAELTYSICQSAS